jgi:hypothetical protein
MPVTIARIATYLNVEEKAAEIFVAQVEDLLGKPVKYGLVSEAIRQIGRKQATPQVVASLIARRLSQQKAKTVPSQVLLIAEELRMDRGAAQDFVAQVTELVGGHVEVRVILEAVKRLKKSKKSRRKITAQTVASLVAQLSRNARRPTPWKTAPQSWQLEEELQQFKARATKLTRAGKWQEVADMCSALLRRMPEQGDVMMQLAWAHYNLGRKEEAARLYRDILEIPNLSPGNESAAKNRLRELEVELGLVSAIESDDGLGEDDEKLLRDVQPTFLLEGQAAQPTYSTSWLIAEFEAERRRSTQDLLLATQAHLAPNGTMVKAKDNSSYPIDLAVIEASRNPQRFQELVTRSINQEDFGRLQQLMILLAISAIGVDAKLEQGVEPAILDTVADSMLRNRELLTQMVNQTIAQARRKGLVSVLTSRVLFDLYLRSNLRAGDGLYISHLGALGQLVFGKLPSHDLKLLRTFASNSIWVLAWRLPPISLPLLLPDLNCQEIWVCQEDLASASKTALSGGRALDAKALRNFGSSCWVEIHRRRSYQVPSAGRAEILASSKLESLTSLKLIRFVQEGMNPPGVLLRFEFGEQPAIGLVKVRSDGKTEGFHEFVESSDVFQPIVEAVALSYFRDLVTPGKVYYYESGGGTPRTASPTHPRPGRIPRPQGIPIHHRTTKRLQWRQPYNLNEWYYAQERARHGVTGHIRWVGYDFEADWEKRQQALEAGVILPLGYTWVVEHERGGPGSGRLRFRNGRLTQRTLFLPPDRASEELDQLLP